MFKIREELVVYKDEDDLIELTKYCLNAEKERRAISEMAQKRAYKEHTYKNRAIELLAKCRTQH